MKGIRFVPSIEEGIEEFYFELEHSPPPIGNNLVQYAIEKLLADGIELPSISAEIDDADPLVVCVAEAVNLAAKVLDSDYYELKPKLVAYLFTHFPVEGGWGDDGAFYLYAKGVGTVSFHDPIGEIEALVGDSHIWPHQWTGVMRQYCAFEILQDKTVRDHFAAKTDPYIRNETDRNW